ncbi:Diphthamide biosynthesis protein 2 [Nymphaea thermarum]|nr:Diphthamide biosynthesis protein 2 [Nymphaea thermarum]
MDLEFRYEISRTAAFVVDGNYRRVALQFPDELLKDAYRVFDALRREIELRLEGCGDRSRDVQLYVMADTTYGSCCVDEVAALHVKADCVVHYGRTCLSATSRLPVLYVFGKEILDVNACAESIFDFLTSGCKPTLVLFGLEYTHAIAGLKVAVMARSASQFDIRLHYADILFSVFDPTQGSCRQTDCTAHGRRYCLGGLIWEVPEGCKLEDCVLLWVGSDDAAFSNVVLTFDACEIVRYCPAECRLIKDVPEKKNILKRRYYLVEKAKDANMVGILVGTLGVAGYLNMIHQIKDLIKSTGKKSYTFVVGRPSPAKLANFPECDVFIHVACPQTALLDSKEFFAPVITPFEAILAFSRGSEWTGEYIMEFQKLMTYSHQEVKSKVEGARYSFLNGGYVEDLEENEEELDGNSLELSTITEKVLKVADGHPSSMMTKRTAKSGLEFFSTRSYQGLEIGFKAPTTDVVTGRTGRASRYDDERTGES